MWRTREEQQSSSGVIVSTGTAATGWARSIRGAYRTDLALPSPRRGGCGIRVDEVRVLLLVPGVELEDERAAGEEAVVDVSMAEPAIFLFS